MYKNKKTCEDCKYYNMIDSGYGYCRRFPPTIQRKVKGKYKIWLTYYFIEDYPIIAWTNHICGEFKRRNTK